MYQDWYRIPIGTFCYLFFFCFLSFSLGFFLAILKQIFEFISTKICAHIWIMEWIVFIFSPFLLGRKNHIDRSIDRLLLPSFIRPFVVPVLRINVMNFSQRFGLHMSCVSLHVRVSVRARACVCGEINIHDLSKCTCCLNIASRER